MISNRVHRDQFCRVSPEENTLTSKRGWGIRGTNVRIKFKNKMIGDMRTNAYNVGAVSEKRLALNSGFPFPVSANTI